MNYLTLAIGTAFMALGLTVLTIDWPERLASLQHAAFSGHAEATFPAQSHAGDVMIDRQHGISIEFPHTSTAIVFASN